ncbi:MAG: transglycosylase domain-containing protein, partial [Acidimicrobiia bacterium]|nr:transglycosylase domain-containing protein [Acidimicrobiia bacterium]
MGARLELWWLWVRGLPWRRIALVTVAVTAIIVATPPLRRAVAAGASRVALLAVSPFAPSIRGFDALPQASTVVASDGSVVGRLGNEQRQPVDTHHLPPHVAHAVLAAEDAHFYQHGGVDLTALTRAAFNDVRSGHVQGGSTITQQLAKLNYTGSQRTVFRKLREVLYAAKLEQRYSKDELLDRYLNQVYFGDSDYGIAAASAHYFGVAPDHLTVEQAATLAGIIHSPANLNPYAHPDAALARRNQVIAAMHKHGWLSDGATQAALSAPLGVIPKNPSDDPLATRAPHFVQFVGREMSTLDELGGTNASRAKQAYTGGYTIETTLDPKALDAATSAARQTLGAPGDPTTAVASVQPGDGAIRVLFGGLDGNRRFDVASQGRRQPGSSFKPFLYVSALEAGIDPRTKFDSASPKTVQCAGAPWTVHNYEGEGGGQITVDDAMAHSVNTVFQQLMTNVGPGAMQRTAIRLGIAKDDVVPARCAMALGGLPKGVSPLEQAAAYATFAAKGVYAQPYSIVRIRNRQGQVVYEHQTKTTPALPPAEAGVLNAALEGVVNNGTGTAAGIGRPLAGKTGTTENHADAWFIGYVPQLSTAVWVGYPDSLVPMTDVHGIAVAGGTYPARIFSRYMKPALAGTQVQDIYTASPDDLSLHNMDAPPPPPPSSSSTSTSTSVPGGLPPANIQDPGS